MGTLQPWGALEIIVAPSSGFTYAIWQFVYFLSVILLSALMTVAEATEISGFVALH